MKQIIKHGHAQYRATCPFCECEFTFEHIDLENNGRSWDYYEWVTCPECRQRIEIEDRKTYAFHTT